MMPKLQAEETHDRATAAALGAGTMKAAEARRITAALRRQAAAGRRTPKAHPQVLAMIGIEVRRG